MQVPVYLFKAMQITKGSVYECYAHATNHWHAQSLQHFQLLELNVMHENMVDVGYVDFIAQTLVKCANNNAGLASEAREIYDEI